MAKININEQVVLKARTYALDIANDVQSFIDLNTTVATERSIARLLGIDGVSKEGIPYPNVIVDHLKENGVLGKGVCLYLGNAMYTYNCSALEVVQKIDLENVNICKLPFNDLEAIKELINEQALMSVNKIKENVLYRSNKLAETPSKDSPLLYLIVATGNIYEDVKQAQAAVIQGADIIAVIRTTGQSLLDFVPYGATTEGFGGTYATQENFRIMRKALDEVGSQVNRYIRLCNYCSGLCMPEIAAMGAIERLDVMLNDALYGILFRDINMKRTLIDQYFSRVINGFAQVIINTGEDNYLTTS
ncbi:MAG: lysine 5,6-aminomutase subunit alpha TIM-barrel domain-containing protein, partial [Bacilli bacterium]